MIFFICKLKIIKNRHKQLVMDNNNEINNENNMEELSRKYMNDELSRNEITREIVKYTYLNYYPEEDLFNYPQFFMNKLNNNVNLLSNENRDILQNYINNNQTIDRSNIEEFFNFVDEVYVFYNFNLHNKLIGLDINEDKIMSSIFGR